MKRCTKCKEEKELSEFGKKSASADGLDWWCRQCVSIQNYKNKDSRNEYLKAQRREKKGVHTKYCMRWKYKKLGLPIPEKYQLPEKQSKTREEALASEKERKRLWKIENREKDLAQRYEYRHSEKGKKVAIRGQQKRRSLAAQVPHTFTEKDFDFLYEFQDGKCAKCGVQFSEEVGCTRDHIVPLSKGGGYTLENIQLLCKSCNSSKYNKVALYRNTIPL